MWLACEPRGFPPLRKEAAVCWTWAGRGGGVVGGRRVSLTFYYNCVCSYATGGVGVMVGGWFGSGRLGKCVGLAPAGWFGTFFYDSTGRVCLCCVSFMYVCAVLLSAVLVSQIVRHTLDGISLNAGRFRVHTYKWRSYHTFGRELFCLDVVYVSQGGARGGNTAVWWWLSLV